MSLPQKTFGRITGFTWGAAVGICVGYDWEFSKDSEEVSDEDSIVVDSLPTRRLRKFVNIEFLHTPPTDSDTPATGTINERLDDGTAVATALGSIKLISVKKTKGKDSVAMFTARFQCVGTTILPVAA